MSSNCKQISIFRVEKINPDSTIVPEGGNKNNPVYTFHLEFKKIKTYHSILQ